MSDQHIVSPLPGIFYRRPAPDQPPYKEAGDRIAEGDTLGLVEVMKSFHELNSDRSGTISKFLVENEGAIIAGQPIVEVED